MTIYNNILETIGRTPVVRINRLAPAHVTMYAKVEYFNPGGSVKDRLAMGIIEDAERRGVLQPGQTIVEATSGNTGIALALVAAAKGYPFVAVMVAATAIAAWVPVRPAPTSVTVCVPTFLLANVALPPVRATSSPLITAPGDRDSTTAPVAPS